MTFFFQQFDSFLPNVEREEDPHVCMILPAKKYEQIFEICQNYPKNDLLAFGFFEGENFDDYKLICKTIECYEHQPKKKGNDKLIMNIARKTSQLMLALSTMGPIHVSLTHDDAREECSKVFNEEFDTHKDAAIDMKKMPK